MSHLDIVSYEVIHREKYLKIRVNEETINDDYNDIIKLIGRTIVTVPNKGELVNGRYAIKTYANRFMNDLITRDHRFKTSINEIKALSKSYTVKDNEFIYIPYKAEYIIFTISILIQLFIKAEITYINEYVTKNRSKTYCNLFFEYYKNHLDIYARNVSNKLNKPTFQNLSGTKFVKRTIKLNDKIKGSKFLHKYINAPLNIDDYIEELVKETKRITNV